MVRAMVQQTLSKGLQVCVALGPGFGPSILCEVVPQPAVLELQQNKNKNKNGFK